jgi:hypothetical protein
MSATLTADDAQRLAKLLGMLGSDHVGERASAAAKADALVRSRGLRWTDVIVPPAQATTTSDWQVMAAYCLDRHWLLTPREFDFVQSIMKWRGEPTERQQNWLLDIVTRLHDGGGR